MGTEYSITCKKCKVTRDLDKFYTPRSISNRKEAFNLGEDLANDQFRTALLISFLAEHEGHEVVFFSEHDECNSEYTPNYANEPNEYKADYDFWNPNN